MSEIKNNDIKKIARLARIEISQEETEILAKQISNTISWIENLNEADTNNVEPLTNVNNSILRMENDTIEQNNSLEDIMSNTKSSKYNYFTVPKVIE